MSAGAEQEHDLSYREGAPRIPTREGVELYYESSGEGTAVVCLNNFFINSPFWREYTEELSRSCRVVTYDMCNHGASSRVAQEPTWEEHAEDVVGLLDALEIESAHLIGTSASTQLARDVALAYPERVRGLVLAGPVLGLRGMRRHRQLNRSWLLTLEHHGMTALYGQMYPEVISGEMNEESGTPGFLGLREAFLAMSTPEELTNGLTLVQQGETDPALLSRIEAPTLIVLGDDDILLSPTRGRELAALFPNGRCAMMPNAGHVPFLDDAEGFQAIVREFVEEVEAHA
ncbi:Pimeloyl-ACP methyl ester carboxylesterase [Saccharopolyspora kobensis]|uniref:Pimeloyl-ACP methyl ester carboxylesterase n=1 Tax=Saccharopolyspora kobensis TaxID=146035 RepID=A0A1H6A3Q9_9PSEU|nr:alpha/beta hydrolase [Saccharopolyspora kobensis]SEG43071.1 Pimeloyl-ACP methyl ester carboxylesterase [Saccharopolyspora kobensis]SFE18845.1 Pimeloyl-ACP methyl ester carboxylesterase [Saccharopolyspora kobensis]